MALAADRCAAAPLSVAANKAMIYETAGLAPEAARASAIADVKPVSKARMRGKAWRLREKRRPS